MELAGSCNLEQRTRFAVASTVGLDLNVECFRGFVGQLLDITLGESHDLDC